MTYAELVQKIRDYTEVSSNVLTESITNDIIRDAELRIMRDVDVDANKRYATAQVVSGTRFIDTPQNTLVIRSAQIVDSDGTSNPDNREFLEWRDSSFMSEFNPTNAQGKAASELHPLRARCTNPHCPMANSIGASARPIRIDPAIIAPGVSSFCKTK